MPNRVQTLRSTVAANRPTGRQPGELYVNFPDGQLGVVTPTSTAQDLIGVRFFSSATSYAIGSYVVQGNFLYRAIAAVSPGAFNPTQWSQVATLADLASAGFLPLTGGTLSGPLILNANPSAALGAATKQYVDALPVAMNDNRIINGDMMIDQRYNGAAGTAIGYTCDRWAYSASQSGIMAWQRNTLTANFGAAYDLYFQTQAAYTPLAGDWFNILQTIEAGMVSDLMWGTANAQLVTLSFWAYSSIAGTFGGAIRNNGGTRSYPFSFTLPVSTWTKIIVTIPGDTAGTWNLVGNGAGLLVSFDMGSGATYRGAANVWVNGNILGVNGGVNVCATLNAQFVITQVKLEIGSIATPFNRYSLAKCMADCQRYYYGPPPSGGDFVSGTFFGGNIVLNYTYWANCRYPVPMRGTPAVTLVNVGASGFAASGTINNSSSYGVQEARVCTATSSAGYFSSTVLANAEL